MGDSPLADWMIGAVSHVPVTQSQGVVTFASDGHHGAVGSYHTSVPRSILGCSIAVEVPLVSPASQSVEAAFQFLDAGDASSHAGFGEVSGKLNFIVAVSGTQTDAAQITYDAVAHRFWRMREASNVLYFETSPDGITYVVRHQVATPSWGAAGLVALASGAVADCSPENVAFTDVE
jgi:hypothetical protein